MADASPPTIVAGLVARAIETGLCYGLDRADLLNELGLDPTALEDADNRLPVETFARVWHLLSARLPGRVLALDWTTSWKLTDQGVLGYMMIRLQNVEEAMEACARYSRLVNEDAMARLQKGSPTSRFGFALSPLLLATEHVAESMMTSTLLFLRGLLGQSFSPVAVRFPHHSTSRTAALKRYFGAPVFHDAGETSVEVPTEVLACPLPTADPVLGAYLRKQADLLVESVAAPKAVSRECARRIAERLGLGDPSQTSIARQMAMSERTLQRRLAAEGVTFNELLDDARRTIAFSYLADRKLAAYEVSFLLGYSEPATFFRAFKRWTGKTPQQYRGSVMRA